MVTNKIVITLIGTQGVHPNFTSFHTESIQSIYHYTLSSSLKHIPQTTTSVLFSFSLVDSTSSNVGFVQLCVRSRFLLVG